ncbi:MAG TPA: hypothetical protein VJV78_35585, partial [Polyangiales bacterium]|nr:hypothetical protein [Polyangiales bacterium]
MYESNPRALVFVARLVSVWCLCLSAACGADDEPSAVVAGSGGQTAGKSAAGRGGGAAGNSAAA